MNKEDILKNLNIFRASELLKKESEKKGDGDLPPLSPSRSDRDDESGKESAEKEGTEIKKRLRLLLRSRQEKEADRNFLPASRSEIDSGFERNNVRNGIFENAVFEQTEAEEERTENLLFGSSGDLKKPINTGTVATLLGGEYPRGLEGKVVVRKTYYSPSDVMGKYSIGDSIHYMSFFLEMFEADAERLSTSIKDALFLDLETTGLAGGTGTFAFLVGLGSVTGNGFKITQFFLEDCNAEEELLLLVTGEAKEKKFLVTYNGKCYDVPLLQTRSILARVNSSYLELPNLDLLYPARQFFRGRMGCSLKELEWRLLGHERYGDIPGELIPPAYFSFIRTGECEKLPLIVNHNRDDILAMLVLAGYMGRIVVEREHDRANSEKIGHLMIKKGAREKGMDWLLEASLTASSDSVRLRALKLASLEKKKEGDLEGAAILWKNMIELSPSENIFPYLELAKYYEHRKKDYRAALEFIEKALLYHPCGQQAEALLERRARIEKKLSRLENGRKKDVKSPEGYRCDEYIDGSGI